MNRPTIHACASLLLATALAAAPQGGRADAEAMHAHPGVVYDACDAF